MSGGRVTRARNRVLQHQRYSACFQTHRKRLVGLPEHAEVELEFLSERGFEIRVAVEIPFNAHAFPAFPAERYVERTARRGVREQRRLRYARVGVNGLSEHGSLRSERAPVVKRHLPRRSLLRPELHRDFARSREGIENEIHPLDSRLGFGERARFGGNRLGGAHRYRARDFGLVQVLERIAARFRERVGEFVSNVYGDAAVEQSLYRDAARFVARVFEEHYRLPVRRHREFRISGERLVIVERNHVLRVRAFGSLRERCRGVVRRARRSIAAERPPRGYLGDVLASLHFPEPHVRFRLREFQARRRPDYVARLVRGRGFQRLHPVSAQIVDSGENEVRLAHHARIRHQQPDVRVGVRKNRERSRFQLFVARRHRRRGSRFCFKRLDGARARFCLARRFPERYGYAVHRLAGEIISCAEYRPALGWRERNRYFGGISCGERDGIGERDSSVPRGYGFNRACGNALELLRAVGRRYFRGNPERRAPVIKKQDNRACNGFSGLVSCGNADCSGVCRSRLYKRERHVRAGRDVVDERRKISRLERAGGELLIPRHVYHRAAVEPRDARVFRDFRAPENQILGIDADGRAYHRVSIRVLHAHSEFSCVGGERLIQPNLHVRLVGNVSAGYGGDESLRVRRNRDFRAECYCLHVAVAALPRHYRKKNRACCGVLYLHRSVRNRRALEPFVSEYADAHRTLSLPAYFPELERNRIRVRRADAHAAFHGAVAVGRGFYHVFLVRLHVEPVRESVFVPELDARGAVEKIYVRVVGAVDREVKLKARTGESVTHVRRFGLLARLGFELDARGIKDVNIGRIIRVVFSRRQPVEKHEPVRVRSSFLGCFSVSRMQRDCYAGKNRGSVRGFRVKRCLRRRRRNHRAEENNRENADCHEKDEKRGKRGNPLLLERECEALQRQSFVLAPIKKSVPLLAQRFDEFHHAKTWLKPL
ncbi:Uncharacterised protein [Candidatus Norongarragalina meridionalis]|nr:Uncharacterised protein [Candidatus Norongarragalina meridionalis]